jgi:prepilin-type N-terminal cleavage/methylation domain-containing protein
MTQKNAQSGFTLLEVLAALAVMAVATSVFISLYTASLGLARSSHGQRIAVRLAEEHLGDVVSHPAAIDWTALWAKQPGERATIVEMHTAEYPGTMPTDERAYFRTKNLYENFTWEAHAVRPPDDQSFVVVIVEVRWVHEGRPRMLALTSAVPRSQLREAA